MRGRLLIAMVLLTSILVWGATVVAIAISWQVTRVLASAEPLAEIGPRPQSTIVYDRNHHVAFSFYAEQRIDVPLSRVSPRMIDALLTVEDRRFYSHHGLDPVRIVKAAWRNVRAGHVVEGGSTITQQLARFEQLTPARTMDRKIREAAIAVRLEERYSKQRILQAYLNSVYFGDGYYGVEAAARGYFDKSAADLAPHEAALLAGIVRSPGGYSPTSYPRRALARRNLVLRMLRGTGHLTDAEYRQEVAAPLLPQSHASSTSATGAAAAASGSCGGYYQEQVRRELVARFGGKKVLGGGLQVYTGYDPAMQCAAETSIADRIAQLSKTHKSARELEASLVAIEPSSGEVRALVGGRSFDQTSYIRATQARRQPGSAFKPIIYAAALEHGMAPATVLDHLDEPIMTAQGPWLPSGEHEQTEYSLRNALKISSNRAAAQLLQKVGVTQATYYASRMGIASQLPSVPSLALGTGGVTLLELTSAYGVFANEGVAVTPHLINRVEDCDGDVLWDDLPSRHQAVTPATAFLMSSMLADVITSGTGTAVRASGFKLPAAGKTGTADNYTDAWFIGYTPHLVTGVWFGLDRPAPIMNRGFAAVVAVPAWASFMKQATAQDKPDWFAPPPDVEKVAICRLSGLLATDACRHGILSPDYAEDGLREIPGTPVGGVVGTSGHVAAASASTQSTVYEDYFPIGAVPRNICHVHGASAFVGSPVGVAQDSAAAGIQKSLGPDGRVVWTNRVTAPR